jgi:hypothetical protein
MLGDIERMDRTAAPAARRAFAAAVLLLWRCYQSPVGIPGTGYPLWMRIAPHPIQHIRPMRARIALIFARPMLDGHSPPMAIWRAGAPLERCAGAANEAEGHYCEDHDEAQRRSICVFPLADHCCHSAKIAADLPLLWR